MPFTLNNFAWNEVNELTIILNRWQHQESDDIKIPDHRWLHRLAVCFQLIQKMMNFAKWKVSLHPKVLFLGCFKKFFFPSSPPKINNKKKFFSTKWPPEKFSFSTDFSFRLKAFFTWAFKKISTHENFPIMYFLLSSSLALPYHSRKFTF